MGAQKPASDVATPPPGEPRLPRAERRDPDDLYGDFDRVLPSTFDLVDRRALSSTDAGLAFLPFTLGVGLLSNVFGGLADKIGTRTMLIAGPAGAALAYVWLALGQKESSMLGVIVPMTLLGLSFAVLVAPPSPATRPVSPEQLQPQSPAPL